MRTLSCLHGHARIHGHGHTFTGMRTPSRVCARLHGRAHARVQLSHFHAHTCTAMATSLLRARLRRDQRPALANQAPIQLTQTPTSNPWGAWVSTPASTSTSGGERCCVCVIGPKGPIMVRPSGRTCSRAFRLDDMAHLTVGWCVLMTARLKAGNCIVVQRMASS